MTDELLKQLNINNAEQILKGIVVICLALIALYLYVGVIQQIRNYDPQEDDDE